MTDRWKKRQGVVGQLCKKVLKRNIPVTLVKLVLAVGATVELSVNTQQTMIIYTHIFFR